MYICGLVIAVPEDNKDAYRAWAERSAEIFQRYGCLEIVESWEDFVPDGKQTDFRRAVAAKPGEKMSSSGKSGPTNQPLKHPRNGCMPTGCSMTWAKSHSTPAVLSSAVSRHSA